MKAQALNDNNAMSYMVSKKNLEINPHHSIIQNLKTRLESEDETEKAVASNLINLIYDTSLINSGFSLENPASFSQRMFNMVKMGLGIDDEEETETPTPSESNCCDAGNGTCPIDGSCPVDTQCGDGQSASCPDTQCEDTLTTSNEDDMEEVD